MEGNSREDIRKRTVEGGRDIEFSRELADHDDLEAQERAKEADARAKKKQ
ncbi:YfhD family protein [Salirhabdus salicampi]|nr:YfhD family protein [Salirhabdus salicampi]MCP8616142.1 YfhD family protein [Salirhabdus salicampi]